MNTNKDMCFRVLYRVSLPVSMFFSCEDFVSDAQNSPKGPLEASDLLQRGSKSGETWLHSSGLIRGASASSDPLGGDHGHFIPIAYSGVITHRIHGAAICGNMYHQYTPNVSIYIPYMDPMGNGMIYPLVSKQFDPENHLFFWKLIGTNPDNWQGLCENLLEGNFY